MEKITFRCNGREYTYPEGTDFLAIADEICGSGDGDIVLARTGGYLFELSRGLTGEFSGREVQFISTSHKDGKRAYRRSMVFLMQKALDNLYPDQWLDVSIHHSLGQGYYCSIISLEDPDKKNRDRTAEAGTDSQPLPVTEEFLERLKQEMQRLVQEDLPFEKITVRTRDAEALFHSQRMINKERLLRYRISSHMNVYQLEGCTDYYYGYMVPSTRYLKYFDLRLFSGGFMLLFPDKDPREIAPFAPSMKLFSVLRQTEEWSGRMGISTVGALNDVIAGGNVRDLILVQEAYMEQQIGRLAEKIASARTKKFVLVAGPSSSGKTTFAHRLSAQLRALGLTPRPLSLDDYYLDRDLIEPDENGKKDFENIEALDVDLFNRDMLSLLRGGTIDLPTFNFKTGKREYRGGKMALGEKDVMVIEGIHGLNDRMSEAIPDDYKFRIYISALTQLRIDERNPLSTTDGRLIRRIVRDSRSRGTCAKDTIGMWDSVRRGEEKNIFPYQERADEMFNSALIYEMAVLKIYAQPQLLAIDRQCPEYAEAKRLLKLLDYFLPMPPEDICNNSILREFIGGSCLPV